MEILSSILRQNKISTQFEWITLRDFERLAKCRSEHSTWTFGRDQQSSENITGHERKTPMVLFGKDLRMLLKWSKRDSLMTWDSPVQSAYTYTDLCATFKTSKDWESAKHSDLDFGDLVKLQLLPRGDLQFWKEGKIITIFYHKHQKTTWNTKDFP